MEFWDRVTWDVRRLYYQAKKAVLRRKIGERWQSDGAFEHRQYPDYETYLEHQRTKFSAFRSKSIIGHDRRFHAALSERLATSALDLRGRSVLCLAARQGSEVRAFIDQGAFAVGIDLNPGPKNRYVVVGDFHELQFADDSVDVVYTNSLDHAFDLERILGEVRRVLGVEGTFVVEANVGGEDGGEREEGVAREEGGAAGAAASSGAAQRGPYEALVWPDAGTLLGTLAEHGFELVSRSPFETPWPGEQFVMRVRGR